MKGSKRDHIMIGFMDSPVFKKKLRIMAAMNGMSMSELIREVLRDWVKKEQEKANQEAK